MEEIQELNLDERLKTYQFPYCTKGGDHHIHQLNKVKFHI